MTISNLLRNQVYMLDNFTCVYCGYRGPDVSVDHYIPESLNGPDVLQNLMTACRSCNSRKGDRAPYECGMATRFGRFVDFPANGFVETQYQRRQTVHRLRQKRRLLQTYVPTMREQNLQWLRDQGFTDRQITLPDYRPAVIQHMLEAGMSANKIANTLGGLRTTVLRDIREIKYALGDLVEEAKAA